MTSQTIAPNTTTQRTARHGKLEIDNVTLQLGRASESFTALQDISFSAAAGEFVCLLGPSGCGKSTLLGAVAGHLAPSRGAIRVDGVLVSAPHSERGLVFQHHTLFPWQKVIDNVAFGLKMKGIKRNERRQLARELLQLVGLEGFEQHYPWQLSGGMQQRVEIARVLINNPRVLLMDEPFGALDAITRLHMQKLLLEIWTRIRTTVIFVTHDIDEALFMADRILVMSPRPGRIIEAVPVDFARPRHADLITSRRFAEIKRHCLGLLNDDDSVADRLSPLGPAPRRGLKIAL